MCALAANFRNDPIDVITGDWMSEYNMTSRAALKIDSISLFSHVSLSVPQVCDHAGDSMPT